MPTKRKGDRLYSIGIVHTKDGFFIAFFREQSGMTERMANASQVNAIVKHMAKRGTHQYIVGAHSKGLSLTYSI